MNGWSSRGSAFTLGVGSTGKVSSTGGGNNIWNLLSLERGGFGFDYCPYRLSAVSNAS